MSEWKQKVENCEDGARSLYDLGLEMADEIKRLQERVRCFDESLYLCLEPQSPLPPLAKDVVRGFFITTAEGREVSDVRRQPDFHSRGSPMTDPLQDQVAEIISEPHLLFRGTPPSITAGVDVRGVRVSEEECKRRGLMFEWSVNTWSLRGSLDEPTDEDRARVCAAYGITEEERLRIVAECEKIEAVEATCPMSSGCAHKVTVTGIGFEEDDAQFEGVCDKCGESLTAPAHPGKWE